ncbi:hypothetical protein B0O99DRAFT_121837 [Bisporella sp. PMI_857]|nr:hypothetical protein B0O99DRAFT_121837 [Bisporella sp. PMI_857]
MSSLLIATRCLQGIRYSKLRNTQSHKMLYEHVRKELAPVLLISPLPNDWLQALTLMTLYNMGPQIGKPEFIDSWIVSGHCVQQTMLGVNFTDIVTNIHRSSTSNNDLRALRLWNNACLAHLCFAIGTGRPSIISEAYLNQCSLILDIWNHNHSDDAMILAEIQLYSILLKLLNSPCPISVRGECKEVTDWWGKWVYLTGSDSDRARIFEMNRHFGYVLLYQRSLKNISSSPYRSQTKEATTKRDDECKALISSSVFHASELLHILMRLPCATVETLPDHLQLAMIYAILILAASYPHESNVATQTPNQVPENVIDSEKILQTIRAAIAYCKDAKLTPILPAEHAVAQLERRLKSHGEAPEPVLSQSQDQQEGTDVFPELDLSLWDPSLPSLEDIFGGGAFIVEGFNETFSL